MFEIPNQATAKDILKAIDLWAGNQLYTHDSEAQKLWFVLSALRGPDDDNQDVKYRTTSVIRRESVPNLARGGGAIVASVETDLSKDRAFLSGDHFGTHIRNAAEALGL